MATLLLCFMSQWSPRTTSSACSGFESSPFPSPKPWPSYHKTVTFFGHKSPQLLMVQWLKWDFSFYVNLFNNLTTVVRRMTSPNPWPHSRKRLSWVYQEICHFWFYSKLLTTNPFQPKLRFSSAGLNLWTVKRPFQTNQKQVFKDLIFFIKIGARLVL